jgi:hypothetical protein
LCSTFSEEKLRKHEELCSDNPPCRIDFPKGKHLYFKDFDKLQWNHFCVFSDFGCIFKNNEYIPVSFNIFCPLTGTFKFIIDYDPYNLMIKFWDELLRISTTINEKIENPIDYNEEKKKKLNKSKFCWICERSFNQNSQIDS